MAYHIKIFHGEEIISDLIKPKFSDVEWCYTTLETLVGTDWAKRDYRVEYEEIKD